MGVCFSIKSFIDVCSKIPIANDSFASSSCNAVLPRAISDNDEILVTCEVSAPAANKVKMFQLVCVQYSFFQDLSY